MPERKNDTNEGDADADLARDAAKLGISISLMKATVDEFDYAIGLKDGTVIRFSSAEIHGEWVTLTGVESHFEEATDVPPGKRIPFPCPRGLEVRLSEIAWCCDAPEGS